MLASSKTKRGRELWWPLGDDKQHQGCADQSSKTNDCRCHADFFESCHDASLTQHLHTGELEISDSMQVQSVSDFSTELLTTVGYKTDDCDAPSAPTTRVKFRDSAR
jgi:hypothetical protein